MDWSSIGNALSTGWDSVSGYATEAFNWIGDNPEAANLIGGIAAGVGQAYLQNEQAKDERAFKREMYERGVRDRQVNPGEIGDYGSYRNTLTKGLISNGMIAGGQ
ncbi:hypothetical protein DFO67_108138 [Modicisalibacter xianhensis]|uniref:Uncharacterized protein n=1 Tax=Modicisalibacter xianhensis TaxID=442341 RepID=A0A4R8FRU5_9GAMM|nr:hypothetical protein [Halomonas xianhensis]TDX29094.1 hypothetical protein DFO67_108138 [Halomonas xianhensis]